MAFGLGPYQPSTAVVFARRWLVFWGITQDFLFTCGAWHVGRRRPLGQGHPQSPRELLAPSTVSKYPGSRIVTRGCNVHICYGGQLVPSSIPELWADSFGSTSAEVLDITRKQKILCDLQKTSHRHANSCNTPYARASCPVVKPSQIIIGHRQPTWLLTVGHCRALKYKERSNNGPRIIPRPTQA